MTEGTTGPLLGIEAFRHLERAHGSFGELMVCDDSACRSLWCEAQCLGSLYLDPPAAMGGPGPIPEATYVLGWLMAAHAQPRARILMGGLGCGAGPLALLHHFPDCRIDVAEIDPVVIDLARRHVPLLASLEASGAVTIHATAVEDLVRTAPADAWDLALMDCFQYGAEAFCPDRLLVDLRSRCGAVWLNVVDDARGSRTQQWKRRFAEAGWPTPTALAMIQVDLEVAYFSGNYLLGTAPLAADLGTALVPFQDCVGPAATAVQAAFRATLMPAV